ncbi:MAG: GNAT family N-acetyltransferase [Xanthobacteraceae bacterium]
MHGTIESDFQVELRSLGEIATFATALRTLADRALEPNVFYEPAFLAAAAPVFGRDARAGLVWKGGTPGRLIGFFPVRIERNRYGLRMPVLTGWVHPYAPLGTPLVDRELGEAAIDAWLDHIATDSALPKRLLLPLLPTRGAVADTFDAVLRRRGARSALFARHQRAMLAPDGDRERYLERAMVRKRRKERRRQRNRLADMGAIASTIATEPPALTAALGEFLTLEARGWKGRAGTAARDNQNIQAFVERAVTALAAEGKAGVARLAVDTRVVAAIVTLRSGDTAWCWKIAYDERYSRLSPGVQLLLDVTRTLLDDPRVAKADSCATADHPMIDHIWRERLALADRLICVAPGGRFGFVCALEAIRSTALAAARRMRDLLRR